jgi:hypothetical protein
MCITMAFPGIDGALGNGNGNGYNTMEGVYQTN